MPLIFVLDHLDLIDNRNIVDFFEFCSVDGAAHYCRVEEIFLFLASVQVAYDTLTPELFCGLPG